MANLRIANTVIEPFVETKSFIRLSLKTLNEKR